MKKLTKVRRLVLSLAFTVTNFAWMASAKIFDTPMAYRHGENAFNVDTARTSFEQEPDAPNSLEQAHAYTQSNQDGSIDIVHCYSMRNGLYGKSTEAQVVWTRLTFDRDDYHRNGDAYNQRGVSLNIDEKVSNMAVVETDMTAFLMSQTKQSTIIMHVVPGPAVSEREMRSFVFVTLGVIQFTVEDFIIVADAKKAIFYS